MTQAIHHQRHRHFSQTDKKHIQIIGFASSDIEDDNIFDV